ncbi:hypothetical protein [Aminobacter sp. MDW-2]|uniref:hypothetical protein n=1 Tax=Aminobacter sp. MDW-2 TaxID=2666139 RepID=UPI0012B15528|nr:hypothetical protein [Aminobacter sp. MDW-2]MRX37240.1 hypothetical protein [Aminobacter sp. MDW-2]QNH33250.1 hypothetical protein H5P29_22465 [Aminobacter sp. MDW-2]
MSQLTSLWNYLNASPNVGTAIVGVAASFAGAWGAQVAIFRRDQRREVIATLRAVNEAQALCFAICNSFMSLKSQHLVAMLARFREIEKRFESFLKEKREAEENGKPEIFAFQADLQTLPLSKVPIDRLERVVFEKLALDTRTLALAIELNKGIDAVNTSTAARNEQLTSWYEGPPMSHDKMLIRYLGIKFENGADEKYKQTLVAIESYCNDCIFFSKLLSEALTEHGNGVRRKYRHHIFWRLPKVSEADYSSEKARKLIPDAKDYEQWLSGFQSHPTIRGRIKGFLSRKKNPAILSGNPKA